MQKFINNWTSTLTQAISETDTVLNIDTNAANQLANGFQQGDYYLLTLDDGENVEIVKVIGLTSNQVNVIRSQESTSANVWPTNASIEMRITANTFDKILNGPNTIMTQNGEILITQHGYVLQSQI